MWDLEKVMSKDLTLIKPEQICLLFTDLYVCILLSQESVKYRGETHKLHKFKVNLGMYWLWNLCVSGNRCEVTGKHSL